MTTTTETIDGHLYKVTRDDNGTILSKIGVDPAPTSKKTLSKFGFRLLFTLTERIALDNYAANQSLTDQQKAILATLRYDFQIADDINLNHPLTIQGVNLLEQYGLLGTGRAAQILAGQLPA